VTDEGAVVTIDGDIVRKQYVNREWLAREPDLAAREAAALDVLAGADLPFAVPRALVVDGDTIVMTRVPGAPAWVPPSIERLAEVAVALHAVTSPVGFRAYRRWNVEPVVPAWSGQAELWERAFAVAASAEVLDAGRISFIHRDHHAGNVLWADGRVSGVVDFVEACVGPAAIDSAHVRLNLVHHMGIDAAAHYARCADIDVEPLWDVVDACDLLVPPSPAGPWVEPFVAAALAELG